ncbi:hypothetical protein GCK72_002674 [Caenorhabditis remanei]|uniref:Uncharacterized protein n=1 Tax=Caenorhabditis remanei TaxID=31234 RepID=A0A6A5HRM4_CAERE|nr:hypothetical protein GCK72_002674 [Caenorhabditis remanei]KAF1770850.1 hypothetical protein GCK72_002674 [Caenorhabditis remanei]
MVEMDHSVLGFPAKKHALIMSGVFALFFVLVTGVVIWKINEPTGSVLGMNAVYLSFIDPICLFSLGIGFLCLLKCNSKCILIVCVLWPAGVGITCAVLTIKSLTNPFEIEWIGKTQPTFYYTIIVSSFVLMLGSFHCVLLLLVLAFCARGDGGAEDLYDLEKSESQKESESSNENDKSNRI